MVRAKLSAVVSMYLPLSWSLLEKAMAWTRKSIVPHFFSTSAKAASMLAGSVTSHGMTISLPIPLASGRTRFSSASPWKVKASLAPASWQVLEIAQAIERSLATPMIRPFLPAISCTAAVMGLFLPGRSQRDKMAVVEAGAPLHIVVMIKEAADPLVLFGEWYGEAERTEPNDPSALALATVGPDGMPSLRMVLLKGFDAQGFVFYTTHESRKGLHLTVHPKAAMLFHWKSLRRQVRLEGPVTQTTAAEADAYFDTRARGSQIGAWASDQSRPLESRFALEKRVAEFGARHLVGKVPRPAHWSGFRLQPLLIEFWQDQPFRLHDRLEYSRPSATAPWSTRTLYP